MKPTPSALYKVRWLVNGPNAEKENSISTRWYAPRMLKEVKEKGFLNLYKELRFWHSTEGVFCLSTNCVVVKYLPNHRLIG